MQFPDASSWLGFFNEQEAIVKVEMWIDVYIMSSRYSAVNLSKYALFHIIQAAYYAKALVSGASIQLFA
jgi:hypothetical protein